MMYEIEALRTADKRGCTLRGWWRSDKAMIAQLLARGYQVISYLKC